MPGGDVRLVGGPAGGMVFGLGQWPPPEALVVDPPGTPPTGRYVRFTYSQLPDGVAARPNVAPVAVYRWEPAGPVAP